MTSLTPASTNITEGATPATRPIRVLVCDDNPHVLDALGMLLSSDTDFELVGVAPTTELALERAALGRPDVVIVDVSMPTMGGTLLTRELLQRGLCTHVVALSGSDDHDTVLSMLEAGACAYLLKSDAPTAIFDTVRRSMLGETILAPRLTHELVDEMLKKRTVEKNENLVLEHLQALVESAFGDGNVLEIVGQPIFALDSNCVVGIEALARFHFHSETPHAPDYWFNVAAQVGLQSELELLAVHRALTRLGDVPEGAYLSINASPPTVTLPAFLDAFDGVATNRIVVEITEHSEIPDYPALLERLVQLRRLGIRIAIDDTGAGFANMRHVLKLNPEIIKLDISLIAGIDEHHEQQALARGLINFARSVGASIVAEGIETPGERATLRQLGVTSGQGYLLGRPSRSFSTLVDKKVSRASLSLSHRPWRVR